MPYLFFVATTLDESGTKGAYAPRVVTQTIRLSVRVLPPDITDCPCLVMILFLTRIDKNFPSGQRVRSGVVKAKLTVLFPQFPDCARQFC